MPELIYVGLIFGLFVFPRLLLRFGLPTAVTALLIGFGVNASLPTLNEDATLKLMSLFGITSLFLFAGLDVDVQQLRTHYRILVYHVVVSVLLIAGVTYGLIAWLQLPWREAGLLTLGLLTPSCGFIFDSLETFGLSNAEQFWVKSKAVSTEIVALFFMIIALQSGSVKDLSITFICLTLMVLLIPLMFRFFAKVIAPYAPGSEFAFLLMTAILCAVITRRIGAYYLVGAFFVGAAAHQFEKMLPEATAENTLHAMRVFANFFIPFYFFGAGMEIHANNFNLIALFMALIWLLTLIPLRIVTTSLVRKFSLKEAFGRSNRVSTALLPTLVFGLVIAGLLRNRFQVSNSIFGGLIIYTVVATMLPRLLLKREQAEVAVVTQEILPPPNL